MTRVERGEGKGGRKARARVHACTASNECVHRIRAFGGERGERPREREGNAPKDPRRTKWSPLILRRRCKVHPSPEFSLSLSLTISFRSVPLLYSSPVSLFFFFPPPLYFLSPSTGPGIPSCECKIDGASRDNCCSGTRFQTRVHLEYTWRKALPMVDGRSKGRARSDFSFVKRFFGHDTVCYRSPIQPRVPRIHRVFQEISQICQKCFSRRTTDGC